MPFCPIRDKSPVCDERCAWFKSEIGACAIWAIPELLANIAAIRQVLEYGQVLEKPKETEIEIAEE